MKVLIAILVIMAYPMSAAFAQSTEVKIDLPKRERNLKNWYTDPPEIQVIQTGPIVKVFSNDADNELTIKLPQSAPRQANKTVLTIPASQFVPSNVGNSQAGKIGNFASNYPTTGYQRPILPSGATSHVLPYTAQEPSMIKPTHRAAQTPQPHTASGTLAQSGSSNTMLKYTASSTAGITGGDRNTVKTSVTGVPIFKKRGDLIKAH